MTKLISPAGELVEVIWLRPFCREHGLDSGNLARVIQGERQHHKGWRSAEPPAPGAFAHKPHGIGRYCREG